MGWFIIYVVIFCSNFVDSFVISVGKLVRGDKLVVYIECTEVSKDVCIERFVPLAVDL